MDPSQTRRVVLLVDLHPLLALRDAAAYSASVLAAARRLLSFPALSSSLFAYKPFFSSLSPLLSTSAIHRFLGKSAAFLSFDRPSRTLDALARTLASSPSVATAASDDGFSGRLGPSRASLTAESLFHLAYDCTWEPSSEVAAGMDVILSVRPNLVVMFSHAPQSSKCLSEFLDLGAGDDLLSDVDEICATFVRTFSSVNDLFIARDVHFSWIDVSADPSHVSGDKPYTQIIEKGIKGLGWGFCLTDDIALGSVLIPFGLIYPSVGCQWASATIDELKKGRAELSLEISDVSGEPLKCKLCDVEMFILNLHRENLDSCQIFSQEPGGNIAKIQVMKVRNINDQQEVESTVYASLLLRGFPEEFGQDQRNEDSLGSFDDKTEGHLPDKVLEMFSGERGNFIPGKPVWQLILAFLYRRSLCAFVSVSLSNGKSLSGILRPFTVHSAVMYLMDSSWEDGGMRKLDAGSSTCASADSRDINRCRKRNKKHLSMMHNLNCGSFHEYIFNQPEDTFLELDIEDLYFSNGCHGSKKLRFLQCWMRQINKFSSSIVKVPDVEQQLDTREEIEETSVSSQQETSLPSFEEAHPCALVNKEIPVPEYVEDSESFAQNVFQKISHVLNSKEVDLGFSAERLVNLAICFFSAKYRVNVGQHIIPEEGASCVAMVVAEIAKLLLKKPKDVAAKYKSSNAPSLPSNSTIHNDVHKVREHELQMLFRMEILRSKVGSGIEENARMKMVKDICLLLENIEFDLQGGVFAGESLIDFAGRTIKARYEHSLKDVVHRIYSGMEFFSFDGGDGENSACLPNSNSEPYKDEEDFIGKDVAETSGNPFCQITATVPNSSHSQEFNENRAHRGMEHAESNVLVTAQERRERARRFSHFTSWRQNLQRVWAPKHAKVDKPIRDSFHRSSHKRRRHHSHKDMVCETPRTSPKDLALQQVDGREERKIRLENASLSKALFHSEYDS